MFEPREREAEALKELGERVNRVRSWSAGISVLVGLALGGLGYIMLREMLLEMLGVHYPYVTGAVTIGLALTVSGFASTWVGRVLIRSRSRAWIEAARARHEVAPDPLREFLNLWS
jgi:NhaP-type Na+/H+ or K+/H+ antiporter